MPRPPKPLPQPSRRFSDQDRHWVIGSDEVGWGALAGPYCVAAVAIPEDWEWGALRDSKGFGSPKTAIPRRQAIVAAFEAFEPARYVHVDIADSKKIDELRRPQELLRRMHVWSVGVVRKLVMQQPGRYIEALVDGSLKLGYGIKSVIKGDTFVPAIMLASIIAKDRRDRLMIEYGCQYPGYGFERNMGYGSKEHYEGLAKLGPCPIHRRSYRLQK